MKRSIRAGMVAGVLALGSAAPAAAAPVTVDLRIEGREATLFEGRVTTDVRTIDMGDGAAHECAGSESTPAVTRGAVIAASGVPFSGTWSPMGAQFKVVAGENVEFDPATSRFLAEFENGRFADVGACSDPVATGDRVLFAYATGSEKVLQLNPGGGVQVGGTAVFTVVDGATGQPVQGATVAGQVSGADGVARLPATQVGELRAKATAPNAIRSNTAVVPVVPVGVKPQAPVDRVRPTVKLSKLRSSYRRGRSPRRVRGTAADASGIASIKVRVVRKSGRRCAAYSLARKRFRGVRCSKKPAYASVGARSPFSVRLPRTLSRARYTIEAVATDRAGNRSRTAKRSFRVK